MLAIKTVKVTGRGNITLPNEIREELGIENGDILLLIQEKDKFFVQKAKRIEKKEKNEFAHLLKHSEEVAKQFWGTKADDVWDTI